VTSMPVRLLAVAISVALALILTRLVRRRVQYTVLEANNEFAGFMYSMIGLVACGEVAAHGLGGVSTGR
jgi:hypothetical protein